VRDAGGWAVSKDVPDDSWLLEEVLKAALARTGTSGWVVDAGDFWCRVTPPRHRLRPAGWKLHVSATQLSAPVVLARVAQVLAGHGCAFKFARCLDRLGELLSNRCDRGLGGKFITVYPDDDEQARRLAMELDRATDGLPGPAILSDQPLRPGSLVHYRYGVFSGSVLNNDGSFQSVLVGPDGQSLMDERRAWFSPPAWVSPLFPRPPSQESGIPAQVLIGDRFLVHRAVRHSYRGGVYRATDQHRGTEVILKQARPYVMSWLTGTDARDTLRHEAEMLDLLGGSGLAPRKLALMTHQQHLFLAQELVPGVTLRRWVRDRAVREWQGRGAPPAEAVELAGQLVDLVVRVHALDVVLRDLSPSNVMVTPEGRLRLIDLEQAYRTGSRAVRGFTPAYAAPEQLDAPTFGPVEEATADLYGLGATILWLAGGVDPLLIADDPACRSNHERVSRLVHRMAEDMPSVRRLAPLVLGLTHDDPAGRWSLARASAFLGSEPTPLSPAVRPAVEVDRLLTDGLRFLLRAAASGDRPWRGRDTRPTPDPGAVQHGTAGMLAILTRAAELNHDGRRDQLEAGVAKVAGWLGRRLFDIPRLLPGLYFGRSGTAWALFDAARLLADEALAGRAIELAGTVPLDWPNPDICHGVAGAGMTQLHLWSATGDADLLRRGIRAADAVLEAAREPDGLLIWPIPADFDSVLAGLTHYGFAHGVAGTGCFLLYAGLATDRPEYLAAARRAGETLVAVADVDGTGAWWPSGNDEPDSRKRHWCSGSSGIGTFLIRLWAVTGEPRFRRLAEAAAAAVRRDRWYSTTAACHGLAGDGDYLLDLADLTGDQRYRDWAGDLAAAMHARNTIQDGLMVLPDESGRDITPGYGTGLSGALGFLLRLRHGGPRWWMPDRILERAVSSRPSRPAPLTAAARS
jgi:class IV lanthipeptide synthase